MAERRHFARYSGTRPPASGTLTRSVSIPRSCGLPGSRSFIPHTEILSDIFFENAEPCFQLLRKIAVIIMFYGGGHGISTSSPTLTISLI